LGYLGTYALRPVLDRDATVHAIDLNYRPTEKIRIESVVMHGSVDQGIDNTETSGDAFRFSLTTLPQPNRWHNVAAMYFDDQIDINDMGYQMINNWGYFGSHNGWKFVDYGERVDSAIELKLRPILPLKPTPTYDSAGESVQLAWYANFKNTAGLEIRNILPRPSKDFWITRDDMTAPYISKPGKLRWRVTFYGPLQVDSSPIGLMSVVAKAQSGFLRWGYRILTEQAVKFSPQENLQFSLMYEHSEEQNWLNWIEGNLLGIYDRKQRTTVASMNWFGGDKHELRIKAQLVAFTARQPNAFLGDAAGNLKPTEIELPPFSLSDLAFQVRYRYELLPLAYLYVVYSKGGRIVELDEEDSLSQLYQRPWKSPQADQFTVKLRYRF
jgi:hypothetical protein